MTDPAEAERKRQAVLQDRSITAELRALQAARRREEPMIESMIAMVSELKAIRTEVSGLNQIANIALGNASSAVEEVNAWRDIVSAQAETIKLLQERMDKMAAWAATKGKQLPDQKGQ